MNSSCTIPTLPPMRYVLWLPEVGAYIRAIDWVNRRIATTGNQVRAYIRDEPEAINQARELIRETGRTVELRLAVATSIKGEALS